MNELVQVVYFLSAVIFILGMKRMSSPVTARNGIVWAGLAMAAASFTAFLEPGVLDQYNNVLLILAAISIGSTIAYVTAKRVAMTDMPQMIAIYNGMGGGAAAAIAAVELVRVSNGHELNAVTQLVAVIGAMIGMVSFSGSMIAFAKLQGLIKKTSRLPMHQALNLVLFVFSVLTGMALGINDHPTTMLIWAFFLMALVFGIMLTTPIGGADMPVVISLFNAFTGLAVALEGYVLNNMAMMIAGMMVGSSGTLLTQLMAKAMNRSIAKVLFSQFGSQRGASNNEMIAGVMKEIDAHNAAVMMAYSSRVIIIPGYGMAVAQAQHKLHELTLLLESRGVSVKYAIHPVAGRMPGHMNVLLAEAGVDYDKIVDLEEVNPEFPNTDVALVIGANDVVNPVARTHPNSPIYGMPILDADRARNCIVIKRGHGSGFSGIENHLFYADNTRLLYGDGQKALAALITGIKELS